ncbi:MAG: sodium:proton antiporter [Deltaproteobacteria bacterium]|nr:sodium:proton antiporter [Deltaproteobacteria bacterium]
MPPLWSVIPFTLMLLSIAVLPLAVPHWWESNLHKGQVRAALEQEGVRMPGFLGYTAWLFAFLLPLFVGMTWLFWS